MILIRCDRMVEMASCIIFLSAVLLSRPAWSQQAPPTESAPVIDFGRDILPLFREKCWGCHGPQRQESNFRLDLRDVALAGGDFGEPAIVPGDAEGSPLLDYVSGNGDPQMPPTGKGVPLTPSETERLRGWIAAGAEWPDELAGEAELRPTTEHWSFQPIREVVPPAVDSTFDRFPITNGIDAFVLSGLAEQGLSPSPPADRTILIRRLYLDMLGLHPTPEEVARFVNDPAPDAWERLVEQVLASHHYGERWARHWLDVVRFGESTGYEVNRDRANAWYYRDYVIDALNDDKSYRDFVMEQLAGDALGVDEATGFLVGGPYDIVKSPDINLTLMQRQDELADYVHATSTTFLGLTVACARCHNHKFDPILQRDYYALQAVFAGVRHGERPLPNRVDPETRDRLATARSGLAELETEWTSLKAAVPPAAEPDPTLLPTVNARQNVDEFDPIVARFLRFAIHQTNQAEPCLDEVEVFAVDGKTNVALSESGTRVTSSGNYMGNPKHRLPHVHDGQFGNGRSWISDTVGRGWVQLEFPEPVTIRRVEWGRDREGVFSDRLAIGYTISVSVDGDSWQEVSSSQRRQPFLVNGQEPEDAWIARLPQEEAPAARELFKRLNEQRERVRQLEQAVPIGYVGQFADPEPVHRLYRGDPLAKREEVSPDVLSVMGSLELDSATPEQDRRLAFAKWLVSDVNPLTPRVIVNRVWQYHFGRGIVATPSDFGANGVPPTHPELLDWLALEFMRHGWSLKWLHREILHSSTYRQSSRPRSEALARDADSIWLWRFPPRRLEAEAIRDCVLQLSGKLNLQRGGPGFLLFEIDRENVHHYFPLKEYGPEQFRRMVYMTKIRQERDEVFGAFDCPDGGQTIPTRPRSTTPLQALNLLNSRFVLEQSGFLAERLRGAAGEDPEAQVVQAWRWAFSRDPSEVELEDAEAFVREHGLPAFCRALLNASEFLFMG